MSIKLESAMGLGAIRLILLPIADGAFCMSIKLVFVCKLDRFARTVSEGFETVRYLFVKGVEVVSELFYILSV